MDVITLVVLLIGIVVAVGISAFLVSRMMQSYTRKSTRFLRAPLRSPEVWHQFKRLPR